MRPYALSMAGFDPSGGAGLLADCKTMEALGVYGLGVCTALTVQNDVEFERIIGVATADVRDQVQVLLRRFPVEWAKLGLVDNLPELPGLLAWLRELRPTLSLVWDPVLKASAGYDFHTTPTPQLVAQLCRQLALLTPNQPEMLRLWPAATPELAAAAVSMFCPVLLKGGHTTGPEATDLLFSDGQEVARFTTPRLPHGEKHGSGCVLSAAITAELAKGQTLLEACRRGKDYTTRVLASNDTLLGYHFQDH
ncbi:hydroxymethylpyrimidine/phosphomethylpyrimidine kinase [Hymenobacter sp. HSC-4F20]|uniref:hydroxymethylpyrimidine/phosphomethylpyrimidine kinase n=1 Tax=Hymenobacter sp. HSC-4F20 TaxID=2864135 RepID=UPI001C72E719|nr:hydroxymethylpyrimidine/phosphomethylpyrimidine kinase [Hymenobacter sp. HSC-4F20]MBX0291571.1 hydroxymethylpyrimidine/phosphomethylpyrimidine kinase [Hymenobacter sp. HSC-4F20]